MAILERLCWEILKLAQGRTVKASYLKGERTTEPDLQDAVPLGLLEHQLVLRYRKQQIEDAIYFLEKREYLEKFGFNNLTRVVYRLTQWGHTALANGSFSADEQQAFNDELFEAKPALYGFKVNPKEAWRRFKKRLRW